MEINLERLTDSYTTSIHMLVLVFYVSLMTQEFEDKSCDWSKKM